MQKSERPHIELSHAKHAIDAMGSSLSLDDFESNWITFLRHIERVWNKTANHYGKSPKWNGWQKNILHLRKTDPLLSYLINARGAEEHTVDDIVGREGGGVGINPAEGNRLYIEHMVIDGPNIFIKSPQKIKIEFFPDRTVLRPIKNRGREYPIPTSHLGRPLDPKNVVNLARLGLAFYEAFVKKVEDEFTKEHG